MKATASGSRQAEVVTAKLREENEILAPLASPSLVALVRTLSLSRCSESERILAQASVPHARRRQAHPTASLRQTPDSLPSNFSYSSPHRRETVCVDLAPGFSHSQKQNGMQQDVMMFTRKQQGIVGRQIAQSGERRQKKRKERKKLTRVHKLRGDLNYHPSGSSGIR